jgi:hypothetical protein
MNKRALAVAALLAAVGGHALAQIATPLPAPIRPPVIYVPYPGYIPGVPVVPQEFWGAIAYQRSTGEFGYSYDYPSEREASVAALQSCADTECLIELTFSSNCGVLLDGPTGPVAAVGATAREAEVRARGTCRDPGCKVIAWACTRVQ